MLTIWTLNRCTELLAGQDERIRALFAKKGIDVQFGERPDSGRQLMPENEYFLPIPLKSIGRLYDQPLADPASQDLLNRIVAQYDYFHSESARVSLAKGDVRLESVAVEQLFPKQQLTTEAMRGYYEILQQTSNNVLIGYSQGGLVARYLAFLDRYVFGQNHITAVITVASPNYGSPLANPSNKQGISAGIYQFLLSLLSFRVQDYTQLHRYLGAEVQFEPIYAALRVASEDAAASNHEARELLETAIKWGSGLTNDANSAFDELDIDNFAKPLSVLSVINDGERPPAGVYTGAVISANAAFQEILDSIVLRGRNVGIIRSVARWIKERLLWLVRRRVKLFGVAIGAGEQAAGQIYARQIMREQVAPTTPIAQQLLINYASGVMPPAVIGKVQAIAPFAHDFVIPSVSQTLPADARFLGHYINQRASHNSGKSTEYDAGNENLSAIIMLLERLRDRLAVSD